MNKINATHTDYQMLSLLVEKGLEVLKQCNIKFPEGCQYDFHTVKALGLAYRKTKKITINYYYFKACIKNQQFEALENTMIHEMLHIVANQIDPKIGHRGIWKQLAYKVSNMTQYDITRLASNDKTILRGSEKPPKHIIICENCGKEYHYQRDCRVVFAVKSDSPLVRCGKCKGHLIIKK